MLVTFFDNQAAKFKRESDMTLEMLRELILSTTAPKKFKLPWLKLAKFGDAKTENDCLRHNANVAHVSGVELDYDAKKMAFADAVSILKSRKIESLVYTSPTYRKEAPKWRVLCPFSKNLPPTLRSAMAARVNGVFRGIFSRESFVLSQAYYYGSVDYSTDHVVVVISGDFVDLREDLDDKAINPAPVRTRERVKKEVDGEVDPELVRAALSVIPNDDRDWNDWNRIGMATWFALGGDFFEIFDEWSQKSMKYNCHTTLERWNVYFGCPPNDLGVGTLIWEANGEKPSWRSRYDYTASEMMSNANARWKKSMNILTPMLMGNKNDKPSNPGDDKLERTNQVRCSTP
jgi:primase-like protein